MKYIYFFLLIGIILIASAPAQVPTLKLNETTNQTQATQDSVIPIVVLRNQTIASGGDSETAGETIFKFEDNKFVIKVT